MFSLKIESTQKHVQSRASGILDEHSGFERLLKQHPAKDWVINCSEVSRINSAGLRTWIQTLSEFRALGKKWILTEVSPPLLDGFRAVPEMILGAEIESVIIPYFCESCFHEWGKAVLVSTLQSNGYSYGKETCPQCGKDLIFDGNPQSYFSVLTLIKGKS